MKIYTMTGDQGYTSLLNHSKVSKTDERIELLGTIDELNSHLGLAKVAAGDLLKADISKVQSTLIKVMAGVASGSAGKYRLTDEISEIESLIDAVEQFFPRDKKFVLYGGCELSARLDVARAVARRAERQFCRTTRLYSLDAQAQKYMNRLSDYLYVCARWADYKNQ